MRDERKRVAFFYLVKISEILAIKKAAEFAFKDEISDLKKKIGNEEYSIHLLCAGFSKLLNGGMSLVNDEFKSLIGRLGGVLEQVRMNREDCFGYKINDEMVSKFPQSAILRYYFFINYIRQIQTSLDMLISSFEKLNFSLFTPEFLFGQIECIKNAYESAESLVVSLAHESGVKNDEVKNIINKQYQEFSTKVLKAKYDKKITDVFLEMLNTANSSREKQENNSELLN
jgi:hypothetical protein